jgi:hypothetical protein
VTTLSRLPETGRATVARRPRDSDNLTHKIQITVMIMNNDIIVHTTIGFVCNFCVIVPMHRHLEFYLYDVIERAINIF